MKDDPIEFTWEGDVAAKYDTLNYGRSLAGYVLRRSHALVEAPFDESTHFSRVLEVGAGSGIHLQFVRHRFDEYWMTDASIAMLNKAARYKGSGQIKIVQEDATKLSVEDESFDRLIATHVLEHLPKPQRILREWARVLKPGGIMSIVLPCDPGILWRIGRLLGPRRRTRALGMEYDFIMATEHVNSIYNLLIFINYYFDDVETRWWPTFLPLPDANLIYVANIRV